MRRGKELFHKNCAACHGNDGTGGHAPSLAKSNYKVGASDLALYKVLRDGISGTAMAGFDFSIEERWQLVGFLRSLDQQARKQNPCARSDPARRRQLAGPVDGAEPDRRVAHLLRRL